MTVFLFNLEILMFHKSILYHCCLMVTFYRPYQQARQKCI